MIDIKELENIVGHKINDPSHYEEVFILPAMNSEKNYQRLEFLGDAVLDMIFAKYLYFFEPPFNAHEMTHIRSIIVKDEQLAKFGKTLGLDKFFDDESRKVINESILADIVEALIAAVYLDLGFEYTYDWIINIMKTIILEGISNYNKKDPKSMLKELMNKRVNKDPIFEVIESQQLSNGKWIYKVRVIADIGRGEKSAVGEGPNKKSAEKDAAKNWLKNHYTK